ncbi:MAG: hypothetical protein AB1Y26_03515 [Cycloclasticus sp.]|nr:hypothetical protein A9Q85_04315 [Cycloclasticus sp. 44_32_T64]
MNTKTLLFVLLLSFASFATISQSATQSHAKIAIQQANELWQQSIAAGHAWNTIQPLVAQAKQALANKDFETAIALANEASAQSKQALIQAEFEKNNWINNLPK